MVTITRGTPIADLPELLHVSEAAAWADVAPGTLYEAVRAGRLPHVRLGRLIRIPRAGLAALVAGRNGASDD